MKAVIRRRRETGIIVILAALSMFVLMAFMGLALDASFLYFQKRRMQTAADAAAYAGALEKLRGNSNTAATSAAMNDSSLNGFTDQTDSVAVTVNIPPASGSKAGNSNFIEVIISQPQPTWFMRAMNFTSATVNARAVAGLGSTNNGCVYALNRDTSQNTNGFFFNGTATATFSCGVFSNANFKSNSSSACISTPTVSYTGTYSDGSTTAGCGPTGISAGVPIVDPLMNKYSIPSYSGCDYTKLKINNTGTTTLNPGVYCGGITIGGSATQVNFNPGSYILVGGGLSVTSSATLSGIGVTFFNTYDASNHYSGITINGSGTVTFKAPTSGTYKGLLFYQDPTVTWSANNGSIIAGGANSVYDGILYFPTTDLQYTGNSSSSPGGTDGYTMLIGYNIKVVGTATVNSDFSSIGGTNPLQDAVFAE